MTTLTLFSFDKAFETSSALTKIEKTTKRLMQKIKTFSISTSKSNDKEKAIYLRLSFNPNFLKENTIWTKESHFELFNHPQFSNLIVLKILQSFQENAHKQNLQYKTKKQGTNNIKTDIMTNAVLKIQEQNTGKKLIQGFKATEAVENKHFAIKERTLIMIKLPDGILKSS